ncbi:general secretion pathway protein F [Roseivivax lentus]|uniref:General secretion pathway protein F n=1 Tax=Roseivivax lentus TaxID=633194 RepID=A0A1N7NAK2_9RHOB|nr:type II secretion system F family protein [Roseivivax lentus]SIS95405.1 general secretion pathway protein F [Roseivivax lentus]
MKSFTWRAYTGDGKLKTGLDIASDRSEVSSKLKAEGLFPETIDEDVKGRLPRGRRKRLDGDMQAVLARQLAVLIESGLPVDEALSVAQSASGTGAIDVAVRQTRALVREGAPLSEALEQAQTGFPSYVISAIRVGEASRDLAAVLDTVASHLETKRADRAVLATALIYPAFVAIFAFFVCGILMVTVAPQLAAMFEATNRPLPGITRFMLGATEWIARNYVVLLSGLLGLIVGIPLLLRHSPIRDRWHRALLTLPIVGSLLRQDAAARYLRTLALVIGSRQPVIEGARYATDVLAIRDFRMESERVTQAIESGSRLSAALALTSFVPPIALQLVEAGEKSARVAQMTERAALMIETGLANDRKRIATLIDPMLMLLIGAFVLTIVLSVLLPIFDIQGAIQP